MLLGMQASINIAGELSPARDVTNTTPFDVTPFAMTAGVIDVMAGKLAGDR